MARLSLFRMLADLAAVAHALFVLFVVCGGIVVLRRPRLAWLHLPAVAWGVIVELTGWVCPLTHLENRFSLLGGEAGYGGSFIQHCLEPLLYPHWLTPRLQVLMGLGLLAINAVIYIRLWRKRSSAG